MTKIAPSQILTVPLSHFILVPGLVRRLPLMVAPSPTSVARVFDSQPRGTGFDPECMQSTQ